MNPIKDKSICTPFMEANYESNTPIGTLPIEILVMIFSYLTSLGDQTKNALTCKRWDQIVHNPLSSFVKRKKLLQELEANGRYVGPSTLNRLFGDSSKFPPIPEEIFRELESPCPENEGKQKKDTHILFLMPKVINGTPITINSIEELVKNPKEGNKIGYRLIWDKIKEVYGDIELEESYWVLMTEDVLKGSRRKSREEQLEMASNHGEGYRAPTLLEAIYINFILYASQDKRLLSDKPLTFTCCQEEIDGWKLAVGGFSLLGLIVRRSYKFRCIGALALRKF